MIKLVTAVGFLAVFGVVAYAIVALLSSKINKDKDSEPKNNLNNKQNAKRKS